MLVKKWLEVNLLANEVLRVIHLLIMIISDFKIAIFNF